MNDTNRVVNRLLLVIVGVVFLAVAAGAVLLATVPAAADGWSTTSLAVLAEADRLFGAPLWPGTTVSGAALVALAAGLIFAILLIVFIVRQGRGRVGTVLTARTDHGAIEIDVAVPTALLTDALTGVPGVAGVTVVAYRVRRDPALRATIRCRRGASAHTVTAALDEAVSNLHAALGTELPVFAQLVGGFRVRLRSAVRVDTSTETVRPS